jgi:hypothetical protein
MASYDTEPETCQKGRAVEGRLVDGNHAGSGALGWAADERVLMMPGAGFRRTAAGFTLPRE